MNPPTFTGDEIISDILAQMPESSEILMMHGVSCASCHINTLETLRDGILGHGFDEATLEGILLDLNEAAEDIGLESSKSIPALKITPNALQKIAQFQKEQKKEGFGLRIEVDLPPQGEPRYFLDFEKSSEKQDKIIEKEGIKCFLAPESFQVLKGKTLDYLEEGENQGFKFHG